MIGSKYSDLLASIYISGNILISFETLHTLPAIYDETSVTSSKYKKTANESTVLDQTLYQQKVEMVILLTHVSSV